MALNDRNGLEEERRLFYVAMTGRAARPRVRAVALSPSTSRARRPPLLGAAVALPTDNVAATMDQVTLLRDDATDAADFATVDTTTAVDAHLGGLFG